MTLQLASELSSRMPMTSCTGKLACRIRATMERSWFMGVAEQPGGRRRDTSGFEVVRVDAADTDAHFGQHLVTRNACWWTVRWRGQAQQGSTVMVSRSSSRAGQVAPWSR